MNVEFVRFKAADEVELQGWLSNQEGDVAVLHIHGMAGNGYENYFLDTLRSMYVEQGISFFAIDTRGRGIISDFRQNDGWKHAGSCYEIFEESIEDIRGAITYLKSIGKTRFILQGHSLGCSKIVNYLVTDNPSDVEKVVLFAPTDMIAWASADTDHEQNMQKATVLLEQGNGEELVDSQCWKLDKTPLSAQAYVSKSAVGHAVDMYGDREGGALLGRVEIPMLIPYGTDDIGITHPFGSMDIFSKRLDVIKHANTRLAVIEGASHSFKDYEDVLTKVVQNFIVN